MCIGRGETQIAWCMSNEQILTHLLTDMFSLSILLRALIDVEPLLRRQAQTKGLLGNHEIMMEYGSASIDNSSIVCTPPKDYCYYGYPELSPISYSPCIIFFPLTIVYLRDTSFTAVSKSGGITHSRCELCAHKLHASG